MDRAMDLCALDGYLAALACSPIRLSPEQWVPWIWDIEQGRAVPQFSGDAEAHETFDLILRHAHDLAWTLQSAPEDYQPILMEGVPEGEDAGECADPDCGHQHAHEHQHPHEQAHDHDHSSDQTLFVDTWCAGFLRGVALQAEAWAAFEDAEPAMLALLRQHGAPDNQGRTHLPPEEHARIEERLTAFVLAAYAFFVDQRVAETTGAAVLTGLPDTPVRTGDKVGRNDPCPCGSGRKAKRCCHA